MARKRIKSRPGLFGVIYYYDENGKQIGKSRPGLFGGTQVYYDQKGNRTGWSRPGIFAKRVFTDANNESVTSYDSIFGEVHFKGGHRIGSTRPGFFDSTYTSIESGEETDD